MFRNLITFIALLTTFMFLVTSCATVPDEHRGAAKGATIGAATGAIAGAVLGKDTQSTVLGSLLGALIGGAIGHYGYDQKRDRTSTQQAYNYKPSYGTVLTLEEVTSSPINVRPGDTVELNMTYAVMNPTPGVQNSITETRRVTHNGVLVGNPEVRVVRADGTYTSTVPLFLPATAKTGTYVVTSTVQTGSGSDSREMTFTVI